MQFLHVFFPEVPGKRNSVFQDDDVRNTPEHSGVQLSDLMIFSPSLQTWQPSSKLQTILSGNKT